MPEKLKTVVKLAAYMALPVGLVFAIIWLRTFHSHEPWAQVVWKAFWFVVFPVLIIIAGRIALRTKKPSEEDWKEPYRRAICNSIQFFGNDRKLEREVWVVRQLLVATHTTFQESELGADDEPGDVSFQDARFQVKELMQNGRRRHDELRESLVKLEEADSLADLLESYTPTDITFTEIVDKTIALANSLEATKYGPKEVCSVDLLCYFNWLDYSIVPPLEIPEIESSFRSISLVSNTYCAVLGASASAPHFMQRNAGRVFPNCDR